MTTVFAVAGLGFVLKYSDFFTFFGVFDDPR